MAQQPNRWFTSSRSVNNAQYIEVRFGRAVGVRDSKDRGGPTLDVAGAAWQAFVADVRAGQHD